MKKPKLKFTHLGKLLLVLLVISIVLVDYDPVDASVNTKKMDVHIGRGGSDEQSLSKTITIPNLKRVVNVKVNTGNVDYSVDGEKIDLKVSNGVAVHKKHNKYKYSDTVNVEKSSSRNRFENSIEYDKDGYSGTLYKKGESYSKVYDYPSTETRTTTGSPVSTTQSVVNGMCLSHTGGECPTPAGGGWTRTSFSYSRGSCSRGVELCNDTAFPQTCTWERETTEYYTEYYQKYSGTVYKPGYDYYYEYDVTIEYIDNTAPIVKLETPKGGEVRSRNEWARTNELNIAGTVEDPDVDDTIEVYYRIDNKKENRIFYGGVNKEFSSTISVGNLIEGKHKIYVWAIDSPGDVSKEVERIFYIDNTGPNININPNGSKVPRKQPGTKVTVEDSPAGVSDIKYAWSKYADRSVIRNWDEEYSDKLNGDGNWYLHVKATDKVGNTTHEVSKAFKIDNTSPELEIKGNPTQWTNKDVELEVTATDDNLNYIIDPKGNKHIALYKENTIKYTVSQNGRYTFVAEDLAGNRTEKTVIVDKIDTVAPELSINGNPNKWVNKDIEITIKVFDKGSGYGIDLPIGTDPDPWPPGYIPIDPVDPDPWPPGYIPIDPVDPNPPKTEIKRNKSISLLGTNISNIGIQGMGLSSSDDTNASGIKVIILPDGSRIEGSEDSLETTFTINKYGVYTFKVEDNAGNVSSQTITALVDKSAPTVKADIESSDWTNKNVKVNLNYEDTGGSGVKDKQYAVTQSKDTPTNWNNYVDGVVVSTESDSNYVHYRVTDHAGNETKWYFGPYKIDKTRPNLEIDDVVMRTDLDEHIGKYVEHRKGIPIKASKGLRKAPIVRLKYTVTEDKVRPLSWDKIESKNSLNVSAEVDTKFIVDNYIHVEVEDAAGNITYHYKGKYRVNDPIKLNNLKITDNDPGVMKLIDESKTNKENTISVDGKDAYVLKKNNFGNRYEVDITNRDEDPIKVEYVVKKDNKEYSRGKDRKYEFNVNYFSSEFFDTWDDGVYEVEVTAKDYDGEIKDETFMSESKDSVYVLIKRNAPPKPKIIYDESKETVTINYPKDFGLFSKPDIMKHYKKQYFINDESGIEDWVGESIKIDKNCTITALYTDIAGNTSKDVLNIVYKPKVGEGDVEGNLDVLVEETRSSKNYFINTRRNDTGKLDETKLDFLQKFRKE